MNYVVVNTPADEKAVLILDKICAVSKATAGQPGAGGGRHFVVIYTTNGTYRATTEAYDDISKAFDNNNIPSVSVKTQSGGKAIVSLEQIVAATREPTADRVPSMDIRGNEVIHLQGDHIIRLSTNQKLAEFIQGFLNNENKNDENQKSENRT